LNAVIFLKKSKTCRYSTIALPYVSHAGVLPFLRSVIPTVSRTTLLTITKKIIMIRIIMMMACIPMPMPKPNIVDEQSSASKIAIQFNIFI